MTDAPNSPDLHLPKDKKVLVIGGGIALIGFYWWWNRAPATPPALSAVPASSDATRVPLTTPDGTSGTALPSGPAAPVDDAAWAQKVLIDLGAAGQEPTAIASVTSKWLNQDAITTPREVFLVSMILTRDGLPPSGLHPVLGGTVPPPPGPPSPTPGPVAWRGPLYRTQAGGPVTTIKVPATSAWLWWVRNEYKNLPPTGSQAELKAAAFLRTFNVQTRGRQYNREILNPKDTPYINIPAAIPIYS